MAEAPGKWREAVTVPVLPVVLPRFLQQVNAHISRSEFSRICDGFRNAVSSLPFLPFVLKEGRRSAAALVADTPTSSVTSGVAFRSAGAAHERLHELQNNVRGRYQRLHNKIAWLYSLGLHALHLLDMLQHAMIALTATGSGASAGAGGGADDGREPGQRSASKSQQQEQVVPWTVFVDGAAAISDSDVRFTKRTLDAERELRFNVLRTFSSVDEFVSLFSPFLIFLFFLL